MIWNNLNPLGRPTRPRHKTAPVFQRAVAGEINTAQKMPRALSLWRETGKPPGDPPFYLDQKASLTASASILFGARPLNPADMAFLPEGDKTVMSLFKELFGTKAGETIHYALHHEGSFLCGALTKDGMRVFEAYTPLNEYVMIEALSELGIIDEKWLEEQASAAKANFLQAMGEKGVSVADNIRNLDAKLGNHDLHHLVPGAKLSNADILEICAIIATAEIRNTICADLFTDTEITKDCV